MKFKFTLLLTAALALANQMLKVRALESYQVELGSIVFPWLEAGTAVAFIDPAPATGLEPTNFFMSNFSIPLALGQMDVTAKRPERASERDAKGTPSDGSQNRGRLNL